ELNIIGQEHELEPAIEVAIFRVIQESLNNIRKHSKATNAMIAVEFIGDRLNLSITDNGIVFNMKEMDNADTKTNGGFGLISIIERIELIEGTFHIRSAPGTGTKLTISVPLIEED